MFRTTRAARLSFWELPIAEQFQFLRWWKHGGEGDRAAFAKELPRTVHGFYEYQHPRTDDICRYYPYKRDLVVNGFSRPTFTQILEAYYIPPMLDDDARVQYVAGKSGRSEKDVAKELFRMRRLKCAVAQSFRDKMKGHWARQQYGDWTLTERKYLEACNVVASNFGMDFFQTQSYDPYIIYSPHFQSGDLVDCILNKTIRTTQLYVFVEICLHNTLPRARLPGVIGKCKGPLEDFEPSIYNLIELKLSMAAIIAKKDQYVTDHAFDPNHNYKGVVVHMYRGSDMDSVQFEVHSLQLNLPLADKVMRDYYDNHIAPEGQSREGAVGTM